jgi:excisionase family DNA binding protein
MQEETLTVGEARELLGISTATMAKVIKSGRLTVTRDALDARIRLVPRAEVEALAASSHRGKRLAA